MLKWLQRICNRSSIFVGFFGLDRRNVKIVIYPVETVDGYFVWTVRDSVIPIVKKQERQGY
jgi:hypothetical protein